MLFAVISGWFALITTDFRWFPRGPLHAIRSAIPITFAHGPAKDRIGSGFGPTWSDPNPDLARLDPIQAGPNQLEAILALVWVRFRFVFRPLGQSKRKFKCKLKSDVKVCHCFGDSRKRTLLPYCTSGGDFRQVLPPPV